MKSYKLWIDGAWVSGSGRKRLKVENPATGDILASVVDANRADVDKAVSAARNRWRWATAKGFACIYWQQEPGGKWVKGGASRAGNAEL